MPVERRRHGVLTDLLELAQKTDWRLSAAFAALSFPALHMAATALKVPPDAGTSDFGTAYLNALSWTFSSILQLVIPSIFLAAALYSYIKQSRSNKRLRVAAASVKARLSNITVNDFETLVSEGFRRRGYAVSGNGRSVVRNIDLIITKNAALFFVQCKLWPNKSVDVNVIRELYGIVSDKGANGGCIVTSGNFTEEARTFASSCGITLIDGGGLHSLIGPALPS
jgi:restriction system protein